MNRLIKRWALLSSLMALSMFVTRPVSAQNVIIDNPFDFDSTEGFYFAGQTFTGHASTGDVEFIVNEGRVAAFDRTSGDNRIVFFQGDKFRGDQDPRWKKADIFFTFCSTPGGSYTVKFTVEHHVGGSGHKMVGSAIDGAGVGGTVLGSSGPVEVIVGGQDGQFSFTASSHQTTIRFLGIEGYNTNKRDMNLRWFQVTGPPIVCPSSAPALPSIPAGMVSLFEDAFDGSSIDPTLWNAPTPANGSVTLSGAEAIFQAGAGTTFPYIQSAQPAFPATGDFAFETAVKYDQITGYGDGVVLSNEASSIFGIWADNGSLGLRVNDASGTIHRIAFATEPEATAYHTYKLEYIDGNYSVYVDGNLVLGPTASNLRPDKIVIGNPGILSVSFDWTDFKTAYVRVAATPNSPPVAQAGRDETVECAGPTGTAMTLDGSGSSDPDGDTLTYAWSAQGVTFDDATSATPTGMFPLGTTTVGLTVDDGNGETATDVVEITVVDTTPPTITLNGEVEITVECVLGEYAELGATATDICDGDVSDKIVIDASAVDASQVGSYVVTYDVSDGATNTAVQVTRTVNVVDTTPPVITSFSINGVSTVNSDPTTAAQASATFECTNPNGELIELSVVASDECDTELAYAWIIGGTTVATQSASGTFELDAHTVTITATDDADNVSLVGTVTITIEDTTPAEIEAALNPINKPKSGKSGKSSKSDKSSKSNKSVNSNLHFEVAAQATDICDEEPVVTAFITQPLTAADVYDVKYKKDKKKNDIDIKIQEKKITVDLRGPDEGVLLGLLNDAIARGGFLVADGQQLTIKSKELSSKSNKSNKSSKSNKSGKSSKDSDPRKGNYKYEFDLNATLEEVDGVAVRLVVSAVDASGNESEPVEVAPPAQRLSKLALTKPVLEEEENNGALTFGASNYPNPFNPETVIKYALPEGADVRLVIYNTLGQQVRELVNRSQAPGQYQVRWDSRDAMGRQVSSGVYFYRLVAGSNVATKRMMLLK